MAVGRTVTDSTNGFRAFAASLLQDKRINLWQDWLDDYAMEIYFYYQAILLGHMAKEVPVTKIYPPRALGYTKIAPVTGWWSMLRPILFLALGLKK